MEKRKYLQTDNYLLDNIVTFKKVNDDWGGFSNFSREYPITLNDVKFDCSERLFQILRYGEFPDFQKEFMLVKSAFWAKKLKYRHKEKVRVDWDDIDLDVMRFVLNNKLQQNNGFAELLNQSEDKYIVEDSTGLNGSSSLLWGAKYNSITNSFYGMNHMGKLLMDIRDNGILQYDNLPKDLKIFGLYL